MSLVTEPAWAEQNRRYLDGALRRLRTRLLARGGDDLGGQEQLEPLARGMPTPPALETLRQTFGLSGFELDLLLLCAGVELDGGFAAAVAEAADGTAPRQPTFGLALARLAEPHWSALGPDGPLRRWHLVEVGEGPSLTASPLRIDERVLLYLVGVHHLDERVDSSVELAAEGERLAPSHERLALAIARSWTEDAAAPVPPLVVLHGRERSSLRRVAATAAAGLGLRAAVMSCRSLPLADQDRARWARLWEREAALGSLVLVLDWFDLDGDEPGLERSARSFLEQVASPVIAIAPRGLAVQGRTSLHLAVEPPGREERRAIWTAALAAASIDLEDRVDALVDQFALGPDAIHGALEELRLRAGAEPERDVGELLWDLCRVATRQRLDGLAQRVEPAAGWDDLVLPTAQLQTLRDVAAQVRHRGRVYVDWGFETAGRRGLGVSALFAGPSGTGKTMAAEVLANDLRLDLYRIDLSQVVSKYIGETEKNLGRIFDAAEGGGAILLFDEADALFGKRSEVRDSHDRYANIEVSYLLQRMETYGGLAILTTNLRSAIDQAFLRRIRFVVQFPFPDPQARAEIWRGIFPAATPTCGLDFEKLARLSLAGGNIRNIALNAAFHAAEADRPVSMALILQAAKAEAAKLERSLADAEIRGWLDGGQ